MAKVKDILDTQMANNLLHRLEYIKQNFGSIPEVRENQQHGQALAPKNGLGKLL